MGSCMVGRFRHYFSLTPEEENLLLRLEEKQIEYRAGETIRAKGENCDDIYIVRDGWTIISTQLDKDVRSIFDVRLNGDIAGIGEISFEHALYDFIALTDAVICPFPRDHLSTLFRESEALARTFYTILSRDQSLLYERFISLGRRTALEKLAHFIIEISMRLQMSGHAISDHFPFPLRQDDLADLLGLSAVHVNRSMNELKRHGYIAYDKHEFVIREYDRLLRIADFNPQFLHTPQTHWHHQKKDGADGADGAWRSKLAPPR